MTHYQHKYSCLVQKLLNILIFSIFSLLSCSNQFNNEINTNGIECIGSIKETAFQYAELYNSLDTEYELGGQDAARTLKLDCSGLVVMCYYYATENTNYKLLFDDACVIDMYNYYTIPTLSPSKGDLIFMGDEDISHIAILEKIENGIVYFIDCTQKDINHDGIYEINGVSKRNYPLDSNKIKSFGIMKIQEK